MRKFTESFLRKSLEMRDLWLDICAQNTGREDGYAKIDAFSWLNKVTLKLFCISCRNTRRRAEELGAAGASERTCHRASIKSGGDLARAGATFQIRKGASKGRDPWSKVPDG